MPPLSVVRLVRPVVPPMVPPKVVAPDVLTVRLWPPSMVEPKVTAPLPALIVLSPARVTALLKLAAPVAPIVLVRVMPPAAVTDRAPPKVADWSKLKPLLAVMEVPAVPTAVDKVV